MHDCVVVHYGEIGTKGKNRGFFENKLIDNISKVIGAKIERQYGRLIVKGNHENFQDLSSVLGIVSFSPAVRTELDIEKIKEKALLAANENEGKTFALITQRSNKSFKFDSRKINEIVGEHIVRNTGMKVDL